jgi:hypothetical protein
MPIQTVESHRLYRKIADQLSGLIASGEFASGCRLPSEFNRGWELVKERKSANEHRDNIGVARSASRRPSPFRSF